MTIDVTSLTVLRELQTDEQRRIGQAALVMFGFAGVALPVLFNDVTAYVPVPTPVSGDTARNRTMFGNLLAQTPDRAAHQLLIQQYGVIIGDADTTPGSIFLNEESLDYDGWHSLPDEKNKWRQCVHMFGEEATELAAAYSILRRATDVFSEILPITGFYKGKSNFGDAPPRAFLLTAGTGNEHLGTALTAHLKNTVYGPALADAELAPDWNRRLAKFAAEIDPAITTRLRQAGYDADAAPKDPDFQRYTPKNRRWRADGAISSDWTLKQTLEAFTASAPTMLLWNRLDGRLGIEADWSGTTADHSSGNFIGDTKIIPPHPDVKRGGLMVRFRNYELDYQPDVRLYGKLPGYTPYSRPGTFDFVVPEDVTEIEVFALGAQGGGGGGSTFDRDATGAFPVTASPGGQGGPGLTRGKNGGAGGVTSNLVVGSAEGDNAQGQVVADENGRGGTAFSRDGSSGAPETGGGGGYGGLPAGVSRGRRYFALGGGGGGQGGSSGVERGDAILLEAAGGGGGGGKGTPGDPGQFALATGAAIERSDAAGRLGIVDPGNPGRPKPIVGPINPPTSTPTPPTTMPGSDTVETLAPLPAAIGNGAIVVQPESDPVAASGLPGRALRRKIAVTPGETLKVTVGQGGRRGGFGRTWPNIRQVSEDGSDGSIVIAWDTTGKPALSRSVDAPLIAVPAHAQRAAQALFERLSATKYQYTLPRTFIGTEPGDAVVLTDPVFGQKFGRVLNVGYDPQLNVTVVFEEYVGAVEQTPVTGLRPVSAEFLQGRRTIDVTFSAPLANFVPAGSAFTATGVRVLNYSISGGKLRLGLFDEAPGSGFIGLTYVRPDRNPLQDAQGTEAPSFRNFAIQGTAPAPTPPTLAGATLSTDRRTVTLEFSETLAAVLPASGSFSLSDGTAITNVAISGQEVTLTLFAPATAAGALAISYDPPTQNPLQGQDGDQVGQFVNQTVTRRTARSTGPRPVSSSLARSRTTISVIFDELIDQTQRPALSSFSVSTGQAVAAMTGTSAIIFLALNPAAPASGDIRLSYMPPSVDPLIGTNGAPVAAFDISVERS